MTERNQNEGIGIFEGKEDDEEWTSIVLKELPPLICAIQYQRFAIVEFLLKEGVNISLLQSVVLQYSQREISTSIERSANNKSQYQINCVINVYHGLASIISLVRKRCIGMT